MDWLHHPRFAVQRDRALDVLKRNEYQFRRIDKVLFLCGGKDSIRREHLAEHLRRNHARLRLFYAERVWTAIASRTDATNALDVEEKLASLADIVVVIVESPGTFAELGAFAISPPLRSKLLPILDVNHLGSESFIATGPIRWIDSDSVFRPSLWVTMDRILEAVPAFDERIARISITKAARIADLTTSPKHLVFFVSDIVAVFGPCPMEHVTFAIDRILGPHTRVDVSFHIAIGCAMGIVQSFSFDGLTMYYRPLDDGRLPSFQKSRHLDIASMRAEMLSVMQTCEPCVPVLQQLARQS